MKTVLSSDDTLQPAVITTTIEATRNKQVTAIYPQPVAGTGRSQIYGRSPIDLPSLPIERLITPIPWTKLVAVSSLAALTMTAVDGGYGLLAGDSSTTGSLQAAMIGIAAVTLSIAGLAFAFYHALRSTFLQAQLPYTQGIMWGAILFIFPVTQGLRALLVPELLAHTMPATSSLVLYTLSVIVVWAGTTVGITGLLLHSGWPLHIRQRIVITVVSLPYLVAIPMAIVSLSRVLN